MIRHCLVSALRNLHRYRGHSILSLIGLAIGLTVFMLIGIWVTYQLSYDKFHANSERIHRVIIGYPEGVGINEAVTPIPLAPVLERDYAEVAAASRFLYTGLALEHEGETYREPLGLVDESFLTMFSFDPEDTLPPDALSDPYSLIVTESMADRIFGDESALGQTVVYRDTIVYTVTGVIPDVPENSHLRFEGLVRFDQAIQAFGRNLESWSDISFQTYLMPAETAGADIVEQRIAECMALHAPDDHNIYYLQPFERVYLHSDFKFDWDWLGDITQVRLLTAVAFLILLISCFNYVGLMSIRFSRRSVEIGVRQTVGAGRLQIAGQFVVESLLIAGLATMISLILVEILLPWMNTTSEASLSLNIIHDPGLFWTLVIVFVITGIVSGLSPALRLAGWRPAAGLRGWQAAGGRGVVFRRLLVGGQFALAITLVTATLIVASQIEYINNRDLGYDRDHLLAVHLSRAQIDNPDLLRERFLQVPGAEGVTATMSLPTDVAAGTSGAEWEGQPEEQEIQMQIITVDYDYLSTMGMEMAEGRFFSREHPSDTSSGFVVNEAAVRAMGITDPVGKRFSPMGLEGKIIGVVKDFHYASLHLPLEPLILVWYPPWTRYFCVRIDPRDVAGTTARLEQVAAELFPDEPWRVTFLDEELAELYASERLIRKLLGIFTGLAILVATLGLVSLGAAVLDRRTKEIGIRKILGASMPHLIVALTREFGLLVGAASLIAWPISYWAMDRWLQSFVYRIELTPREFLIGGGLILIVAVLTVGTQAFKAARTNPVEALKYE